MSRIPDPIGPDETPIIDPVEKAESTMCVDCGQTIPEGEQEEDPDNGDYPLCASCLEDRGTDDNFDMGESDEKDD